MSGIKTPIYDLARLLLVEGTVPSQGGTVPRRKVNEALAAIKAKELKLATARGAPGTELYIRRQKERLKKRKQRAKSSKPKGGLSPLPVDSALLPSLVIEDRLSKEKEESKKLRRDSAKPKSELLPPTWRPNEKHFAFAREKGLPDQFVLDAADEMREWAEANAHRKEAKKSIPNGWDLAFKSWMRRNQQRRGAPKPRGTTLGDIARGEFNFGGKDEPSRR